MTPEQREIIDMLKERLDAIRRTGWADCRICGFKFSGDSFGEILEKMGRHGERAHPEVVGGPDVGLD